MSLERPYEQYDPEKLIIRDHLAIDRTVLANERTILAYIRTAFMLLASGVTIIKFFPESPALLTAGYIFLPLSAVVLFVGFRRFNTIRKDLRSLLEKPKRAEGVEQHPSSMQSE